MFFLHHTTPAEQAQGFVYMADLLARIAQHEVDPNRVDEGDLSVELSVMVDDTVYELEVNHHPAEKVKCSLAWGVADVKDRELSDTRNFDLEGVRIPLNWGGVLAALCEKFELNSDHVLKKAVDLGEYWKSGDCSSGDFRAPKKKHARNYRVRDLHLAFGGSV